MYPINMDIWYGIYLYMGKKERRQVEEAKKEREWVVSFQNQGIEWYPTEDPENPFSLTTTT